MSIVLISDILMLAAYSLAFFVAWNRWQYRVMLNRLEKTSALLSDSKLPDTVRQFLGGSSRIEGAAILLSLIAAVSSKVLEMVSRGQQPLVF